MIVLVIGGCAAQSANVATAPAATAISNGATGGARSGHRTRISLLAARCAQLPPLAPARAGRADTGARATALRMLPRTAALQHLLVEPAALSAGRRVSEMRLGTQALYALIMRAIGRSGRPSAGSLHRAARRVSGAATHAGVPQCGLPIS